MGIFSRIRDVFRGGAHAALDRMENPEAMINQYLRDMEVELQNAENALVKQMAFQSRIKQQLDQQSRLIEVRTSQATVALQAGDEGLATRAIAEKQEAERNALELRQQYDQATVQVNSFKSQLGDLRHQYQLLKNKRQHLIARHGYAKALTQMQKTMSKTDMRSAMANFERMSSRIETMEAEANARVSLQTPDIDADFRKLSRNADVEAELQSLKAKLAQ